MKAIINVNKQSTYSQYNGHTFPVKDLLSKLVAVNIGGSTVDFSHKEVMIVDVRVELQKSEIYGWENIAANLHLYCKANGIEIN